MTETPIQPEYRGNHDASLEDAERINNQTVYVMYSVFATAAPLPADDTERAELVRGSLEWVEGADVTIRGFYDVGGLRAEADLMVWCHGESVEAVQDAYHRLRGSDLGAYLEPVWSQVGVHRPAEFNKRHVPGFLNGAAVGNYACVYPFVRSYEWYYLPEEDRSRMLREHGMAARDYPDVTANTVASFALGDYEFLLCFEAPELHRIVDVMRELRAVEARLHVREEVPFFTGPRVSLAEWAERQPRA